MSSPQIRRLIDIHQLPMLDESSLKPFCAEHHQAVLFFPGDPSKYPEANDVAMVLPELLKVFRGLAAGVIAASDELALQRHFGFTRWPCLVFLREGQVMGIISEMQNWEDYLQQVLQILTGKPSRIATITV